MHITLFVWRCRLWFLLVMNCITHFSCWKRFKTYAVQWTMNIWLCNITQVIANFMWNQIGTHGRSIHFLQVKSSMNRSLQICKYTVQNEVYTHLKCHTTITSIEENTRIASSYFQGVSVCVLWSGIQQALRPFSVHCIVQFCYLNQVVMWVERNITVLTCISWIQLMSSQAMFVARSFCMIFTIQATKLWNYISILLSYLSVISEIK